MYTTPAIDEPHFDLDVTLGLFDGISCGQEALKRAGITTRIYLASEIAKYPMIITRKNHPLTVQLGDVRDVKGENLPKVDLILGGSPCQGFSFAGKQLNFDDPRSALFFEFVRVLEECREFNPDVKFLLENVMMKQEFQDIISEHLKVQPVKINSSLVSAQNRMRLYWTNIYGVSQPEDKQTDLVDVLEEDATEPMLSNIYGGFKENKPRIHTGKSVTIRAACGGGHIPSVTLKQPEDKGILLKDVLEDSPEDYTLMSDRFVNRNKDAGCLIDSDKPKASNLSAMEYVKNGRQGDYIKSDKNGRPTEPKVLIKEEWNPKQTKNYVQWDIHGKGHKSQDQRAYYEDGKHGALPAVGGQSKVKVMCGRVVGRKINPETGKRDDYNPDLKMEQRLEPRLDEKSGTLTTVTKDNVVVTHPTYRKLTPIECERLQTLSDNYTEGISNTQRYKALGNGWTIDVIVHILQGLKWQS